MTNIFFKPDDIILLLGAGASVDAEIPDSNEMVKKIELLVSGLNPEWHRFENLYRYIRSSIYYADGLDGRFEDDVLYNIERLVNALDELQKLDELPQTERHPLYPFVGTWNPKLLDAAGPKFEDVRRFRKAIIDRLRKHWIALPREETASYYKGLLRFQREYEYPLRVFSLNYDLCIEKICDRDNVQRGFSERIWDWQMYDETPPGGLLPLILYKLHGSTDWAFTPDGRVEYVDNPASIPDENAAIIFGTSYKLQYVDPFLYLMFQLRRWCLEARLIVCIGYGFNDEHINGILQQSLRHNKKRKLLAVVGPNHTSTDIVRKSLCEKLKATKDQIKVKSEKAKQFFNEGLNTSFLADLLPPEEDPFLELTNSNEA